jgi:tRNA pseudouridine38-40 synthase
LEYYFKKLGINFRVIASGRTDKGVHATGQVFNIQIPIFWSDLKKLKMVLNRFLPISIRIIRIDNVEDDFNARFWAKKRVYRYLVTTKPTTPFNPNYAIAKN